MKTMIEATQEQFFDALRKEEANGKDIMPSIVGKDESEKLVCCSPYISEWRTNDNRRELFGKTISHKFWLAR